MLLIIDNCRIFLVFKIFSLDDCKQLKKLRHLLARLEGGQEMSNIILSLKNLYT